MRIKNKKFSTIKIKYHQAGFTLIEVLVSMIIMAIGILGLIKVVDSVIYHQSKSSELTQATLLASNKIEEIKRLSMNEPTGGIYGFKYLVTDYLVEKNMIKMNDKTYSASEIINKSPDLPKMTTSVTLRTFPPGDDSSFSDPGKINLLEVIIKTEWIDRKGNQKNVELGSLIHKRGSIE